MHTICPSPGLRHPCHSLYFCVKVLEGTPKAWLVDLLKAFNSGDIVAYEKVAATVKGQEPVLEANGAFLNEKIRIMRLMGQDSLSMVVLFPSRLLLVPNFTFYTELAFRRPSDQRTIPLAEIATECQVAPDQVEVLLMRAFSLKVSFGVVALRGNPFQHRHLLVTT